MRILHLAHQYMPEYVGGTELYTRWLSDGLSQQGHKVSIFYRRNAHKMRLVERVDPPGVRVWAVEAGLVTPKRRFLATFAGPYILTAFQEVLAQARPDLIHIQHLMGLPTALVKHIRQMQIPFIITLHDYWWVCANAQLFTNYSQKICRGPRACLNCARCALARADQIHLWPAMPGLAGLLGWRNFLLRQVLQAAHKLIAPSQFVADWYAAHNVPPEKLLVIPHGLPLPTLPSRQKKEQIKEASRPFRFAYIGGLSPQKGVHVLVEAFKGLNELNKAAELWIAGDETADPDYVTRLKQGGSTTVRFLGRLAREAVWETLAQIDVIVIPSLWYESFSFLISEAFATGVPVIASRLGPLADRVRHEVDGLLAPPGDVVALRQAMQRFLEEPTLLAQLQAGISSVPTIALHTSEIEALYKAVLYGDC